jgi:hypothetical protein
VTVPSALLSSPIRTLNNKRRHMLMVYGKENAYRVDNVDVDEAEEVQQYVKNRNSSVM